jgi:hypothetical protein
MFLQNVGVEHQPYKSCISTMSAQLDREMGTFSTPSGVKWMS